jgi:hypothetical protein
MSAAGGARQNRKVIGFYQRLAHAYGAMSFTAKAAAVAILAVGTSAFGVALVVWLPADHFSRPPAADAVWRRHWLLRWTGMVVKNALGLVLLPLGIFMALPLVPGPGLVFILIGLSLLDFPGKRSLERRLLGVPAVLRFLNEARRRFHRPPLIVGHLDSDAE